MKTITIFSGGLDSTVLVYYNRSVGYEQHLVSFNYGQKHQKELTFAINCAKQLNLQHDVLDISCIQKLISSALTSKNIKIPEGHYEDVTMKATIVPNRNAIMLSIAYSIAISESAKWCFYAAHRGDYNIYPDCRPEYKEFLQEAFCYGLIDYPKIGMPFSCMDKKEIAKLGQQLGVDFNLTWSCYKGNERHCGKCGACTERKEALLGFDNTIYDSSS